MNRLATNGEGSLLFLPVRLDRDPIVLRGLTSDEVMLAGGSGAVAGIPLGLLLWFASGQMPLLPSAIFLFGPFTTLFFGSSLLRRWKRGKPDTFVYRLLHFRLQRRFGLSLGETLITRSGSWTIRRREPFRRKRLALHAQKVQDRQGFAA